MSAVGYSAEVTFGSPVTASEFLPDTSCTLEADPGLFFPKTTMGIRDENVFALYGQEKIAGSVAGPLFPVNGSKLFVGAIGSDAGQSGTAGGSKVGTVLAAAAAAVTLTYTVVSGAAPQIGDKFQLGSATTGTAGAIAGSQVVSVTNVSGGGPYTLTVAALASKVDTTGNGGAGLNATSVVAPFFHDIIEANTLKSFTIEKNLGSYQSAQFAGCKVNKMDIKLPATNAAADVTYDVMGQSVVVMNTPTTVAVDTAVPFVFAEGSVTLFGQSLVTVTNAEISLTNTVKDNFTVQAQHTAQYITPTTRVITGKLTLVFTSLNDSTYGYFTKSLPSLGTPTQGSIILTMAHPGTAGSLTITIPQANIAKYTDDIKIGDVIMSNLDFTASYSLSTSSSMSAVLANSVQAALI